MKNKELLMIKFYVVDGISYPAAETAVGHFNCHGYKSMGACRENGITNVKFKGSMTLNELSSFIDFSDKKNNINIDPLEYYLENFGFGVETDEIELFMAEQYLVNGISYTRAEKLAKLNDKIGFGAMYSVCKLGGFYGAKNKGSMTKEDFNERKKTLDL